MSGGHAVVVGAGLAGLCAARVLAEHFERVTIVERDALPRGAEDRPGVPQGRHVHALLARGAAELETLFPGLRAALVGRGAVEIDMGDEAAILRGSGWARRERFGVPLVLASRRLIEACVRERLLATEQVTVRDRTTVTELRSRPDGEGLRATGASIVSRDPGSQSELAADLVVDASGRASKAPDWLRSLGLEPPAETLVDAFAAYTTRWYRAPERPPPEWWWKAIVVEFRPPECTLGGVLIPIEDGQWMVTLGGLARCHPPMDEDGFTAALRWIRSPLIAEAVAEARPISPVYGNRQMSNRLRRYERWRGQLAGFVAIGDSAAAFNPIYGQGMTTAAICARALGEAIRAAGPTDRDLPRVFFGLQARAQRDPWAMATGADFRVPEAIGDRPLSASLLAPYFEALVAATAGDPVVHRRFFEVLQMLRPLSALFTPSIVGRVAIHALAGR
jgi:2-polyprenyl-6-methoxyphenol hydroxylase-like FAD-dependent oxidoreductase